MDGFQGELRQSIQFRLSLWLSVIILVGALAASSFSFVSAFQEVIELQDEQLRQIVALMDRQHWPIAQVRPQADGMDVESRVAIQLLRPPNSQVPEPISELPGLPVTLPDGLQTLTIRHLSWRVFVKTLNSGQRVAIAQQTAERDEIARDSALRTLMPFLILIPILLLLVSDLIRKLFKELTRMASDLDGRSEQDLRAIDDAQLPPEIRPFVVAINRLLLRVDQSVVMQRRFVADAAHELRSPLTVLSLQAERLEAAQMSEQARESFTALRNGIQRTRSLLDQLLTFARMQNASQGNPEFVSVHYIFREVLEDLLPLAEAKHLDIGVASLEDAHVNAHAAHLKTLVKNLVDNAIRYTPNNGQIDLAIWKIESTVILQIQDTGPGIPEPERQRVFDPFYRVLGNDEVGSGLGLSIVQTIAEQLGADIHLSHTNEQTKSGLCVKITFPSSNPNKSPIIAEKEGRF